VEFQEKIPALKRRQLYHDLNRITPDEDRKKLSTSFSIIENHIFGYIKGIEKKAKYRTFFEKMEASRNDGTKSFGDFLRFNQALSNPALSAQSGSYGIPLTNELDVTMDPTQELSPEIKAIALDILKEAKSKNKALFEEKRAVIENLILFQNLETQSQKRSLQ
jgi:hypothetical protein